MWKILWARFILWREGYCFKHNEFRTWRGSYHSKNCCKCTNINRDLDTKKRLAEIEAHKKSLNKAVELIKKA